MYILSERNVEFNDGKKLIVPRVIGPIIIQQNI